MAITLQIHTEPTVFAKVVFIDTNGKAYIRSIAKDDIGFFVGQYSSFRNQLTFHVPTHIGMYYAYSFYLD